MPLFPEIDELKTKENVKKILKSYPRWRRIAGDVGEQKITATYSFEPRQLHGKPSQVVEKLALNRVTAESELEAIELAVSNLFNPFHRRILIDKFLTPYPEKDYVIYNEMSLSESLYYELLDAALIAFAELYRHGEQIVLKNGECMEKR